MSLTKQDLSDVRDVIIGAIDTMVSPRFDTLEQDVSVLKSDVSVLKSDVSSLKSEMIEVKRSLHNLVGKAEGLENDVREIYTMLAELQKDNRANKRFSRMSLEEKLLQTHTDLVQLAKEAGVSLPNH